MKTINVTCRELFDNFADNFKEYFWCEPADSDKMNAPETLRTICQCENKDKAGIVKLRGYFASGDTVFLMGSKMKELDTVGPLDEIEIRVYNSKNSLVCVLVNDEINW